MLGKPLDGPQAEQGEDPLQLLFTIVAAGGLPARLAEKNRAEGVEREVRHMNYGMQWGLKGSFE